LPALAGAAETGVTEPNVANNIAVPAAMRDLLRERCSGERTGVSPELSVPRRTRPVSRIEPAAPTYCAQPDTVSVRLEDVSVRGAPNS